MGYEPKKSKKVLLTKGASQTMKSKHLEGKAVDLMAYIDGRGTWELNVYDEVADAMKYAAKELDVKIRWGAAWTVHSLGDYNGTSEDAMMEYIDIRRAEGKRPFIDAPHFELDVTMNQVLTIKSAKRGTRSTGNVSKGSRPTNYAKGGRKGNMMVKPCPCVLKKK